MPENLTKKILNLSPLTAKERVIAEKVVNNHRISANEGLYLFEHSDLAFLGLMASHMKERISGQKVFFNRNFHIEPTNLCIYNCKFCSYRRNKTETGAWEHTIEEIIDIVKEYRDTPVTEVHIVGGVHPDWDIQYYSEMLKRIHAINPDLHIKAFSAIELDFIFQKSEITIEEGLKILKKKWIRVNTRWWS